MLIRSLRKSFLRDASCSKPGQTLTARTFMSTALHGCGGASKKASSSSFHFMQDALCVDRLCWLCVALLTIWFLTGFRVFATSVCERGRWMLRVRSSLSCPNKISADAECFKLRGQPEKTRQLTQQSIPGTSLRILYNASMSPCLKRLEYVPYIAGGQLPKAFFFVA